MRVQLALQGCRDRVYLGDSDNYSPMWDARVNMWTEAAIKNNKVNESPPSTISRA